MRVATYARYSSDLQRETSIEDQLTVARRYAAEQRWQVLSDHLYSDAGISGASINGRPGLQALLAAATLRPAPFDIVLTDDSSRISRDLADALRVMQTLKFHGVRVIYISQGIDSASEQADALITMHGLIDQLYLKETAKKIKRGLQGQLERGYSTGNRTYGYRTVPVPDPSGKLDLNGHPVLLGKKPVICEDEAAVVRQIFEWAVSGIGAQTSVRRLRARSTPGPRGETWKLGAVKRILRNERYLGRLIWGQHTTERKPGSNLKIERKLPRERWKVLQVPELRIVSDEVWEQVQARVRAIAPRLEPGTNLARGRLPGHHSKYVLSGFMKCGLCGGAVSIVSCSRTYGPRYSCRRGAREGSCTNRIEIKRKTLEDLLLARLKTELESPKVVDYVAHELRRRVDEARSHPQERQRLAKEVDAERRKLQNLVAALEDGRASSTVLEAIQKREATIQRLQAELTTLGRERRPVAITQEWIRSQLSDLSSLLSESGERARAAFRKLALDVHLHPVRPRGAPSPPSRRYRQPSHAHRRFHTCGSLEGETGSRKELAARAIWARGARRAGPFIPVNCGAIPDGLIETELFGHGAGAFTDAKQAREGVVAEAQHGILFLDEVNTLSARGQVTLLRFLQDLRYRPVGTSTERPANVRIIAASNQPLHELVGAGRFRQDLFYRLNILELTIPPLRQRQDEILLLVEHFLQLFCWKYSLSPKRLHPTTAAWLRQHSWPGNVRELENWIHREVLLAEGDEIRTSGHPMSSCTIGWDALAGVATDYRAAKARALAEFDSAYLSHVLTAARGNVTVAARMAGKERRSFGRLLKKHGIDRDRFRN